MPPAVSQQSELDLALKKRFAQLPQVVQDAITSADVEKHLRALADTHKLHLDQWELLENEVMLALLGVQPAESLAQNIKSEVGIPQEDAAALAADISRLVFEPVREQLERSLSNPSARNEPLSDVEKLGQQVLAQERGYAAAAPVAPATPPTPPPVEKAVRAPVSAAYHGGEASTVRKSVDDDPYREPVA